MKYYHSIIFLFILLAGCSSNSSLTNSFGNRKYTKGVFLDKADQIEVKPYSYRAEVQTKNEVVDKNTKMPTRQQALLSALIFGNQTITPPQQAKVAGVQPNIKLIVSFQKIMPEPKDTTIVLTGKSKKTNLGVLGFCLIIGGIVSPAFLSILSPFIIIAGLIVCINALIHTDKHKNWAIAGVIIASIIILAVIVYAIIAKV